MMANQASSSQQPGPLRAHAAALRASAILGGFSHASWPPRTRIVAGTIRWAPCRGAPSPASRRRPPGTATGRAASADVPRSGCAGCGRRAQPASGDKVRCSPSITRLRQSPGARGGAHGLDGFRRRSCSGALAGGASAPPRTEAADRRRCSRGPSARVDARSIRLLVAATVWVGRTVAHARTTAATGRHAKLTPRPLGLPRRNCLQPKWHVLMSFWRLSLLGPPFSTPPRPLRRWHAPCLRARVQGGTSP